MNLVSWLHLALSALRRNRVRALLTTVGVMFGVGAVIAMLAVGTGSQRRIAKQLETMGTNNLTVIAGSATRSGVRAWAGTATRLQMEDADAIAELPAISTVAPIAQKLSQVRYLGTNWATQVEGVTPAAQRLRRRPPSADALPSPPRPARHCVSPTRL